MIFKNLNSQRALGRGYTDGINDERTSTGTMNTNTFCYGNPNDGTKNVKFLGIEDMWGNLGHWLDGVYCDDSYNILTDYRNSQFTGSDHDFQFSTPTGATRDYYGYINKIIGTNTSGFVKDYNNNTDGINSTYFADDALVYSGSFGGFAGGNWDSGGHAGIFRLNVACSASTTSYPYLGARLMYKKIS